MNSEIEILLVEDNATDADLIKRALKKNNFANKVMHLKDGQEALDYVFGEGQWLSHQLANVPRVMLLDLKMPKVSGIEVLQKLKDNVATRGIPVIMLTSSKEDPDIKLCYSLGVNSYVVKPLEFDEFVKAISQLGVYWLVVNHPES